MGKNELGFVGAAEKTMTTREVAAALGVTPHTITNNAKKCLPNKKIEVCKPTFWTEAEVTVLVEALKSHDKNLENDFLGSAETSLTPSLRMIEAMKMFEAAANEELARLRRENEAQQAKIAEQGELLDDWTLTAKGKIDRQKLFAKINRLVRERAQIDFGGNYAEAFNYYYSELGGRHCFAHKINMAWLRKDDNLPYAKELLEMLVAEGGAA